MTTELTIHELIKLAKKNKLSAYARYVWQERTGYDPLVAAYSLRDYGRTGAVVIAFFVVMIVVSLSLGIALRSIASDNIRTWFAIACIVGFVMLFASALYFDKKTKAMWKKWENTLEFLRALTKLAEMLSVSVDSMALYAKQSLELGARAVLVRHARSVLCWEEYFNPKCSEQDTPENRVENDLTQLIDARRNFKSAHIFLQTFDIAEAKKDSYFADAREERAKDRVG